MEKYASVSNVGHLGLVLRSQRYRGRAPLEVSVKFSDMRGTLFERIFILHPGHGGMWEPDIRVTTGSLSIKRP